MQTAVILLVEDNALDIRFALEAMKDAKLNNRIHVVRDGEEAIEFLFRRGKFVNAPRPDIILLDLNLPKIDGREVLERLKADPILSHIPVVIMTASSAETDIVRSFDLDVNCYVTKPIDIQQVASIVGSIGSLSFSIVTNPAEARLA